MIGLIVGFIKLIYLIIRFVCWKGIERINVILWGINLFIRFIVLIFLVSLLFSLIGGKSYLTTLQLVIENKGLVVVWIIGGLLGIWFVIGLGYLIIMFVKLYMSNRGMENKLKNTFKQLIKIVLVERVVNNDRVIENGKE